MKRSAIVPAFALAVATALSLSAHVDPLGPHQPLTVEERARIQAAQYWKLPVSSDIAAVSVTWHRRASVKDEWKRAPLMTRHFRLSPSKNAVPATRKVAR